MTDQTPTLRSAICPVLIGRESILRSIEGCLDAAAGGKGQTLILSGEAGIGKSRLVAEARVRAGELGFLTLQGACFEPDRALPYAPLLDLLRSFLAGRPDAEILRAFGPSLPELAWLLPELAPGSPGNMRPQAPVSGWEKRRFLETLAGTLARLATPGDGQAATPVLAIVEDLHWSDASTLEFLLYLARRISEQPILLLLTLRSDETSGELGHFLATLERERLATEISPPRLDRQEVHAMLRAIFDLPRPARAEFLELIYGLTEGNPFFVEELLKSMIVGGEIYYDAGRWDRKPMAELTAIPRSVGDAVQRRLAGLSPSGRRTVRLAAVIGRRFTFGLLQELTGLPEKELLEAIKELIGAQLLVEESAEGFAFRHALTREVVYSTLLQRERRGYHCAVAEAMARLYGQTPDTHVGDLALHFYEAQEWEEALAYSERAAEAAAAIYAPAEAAGHYSRAIEAAGHLPQSSALARLHGRRGRVRETTGDFEGAQADYNTALAMAQAAGDQAGAWQALLDLGFLWAARDYENARGYLEQALALARHMEDPGIVGHTLNRVGNWYGNAGQIARAVSHHEEALEIFEELGDRRGLAETWDLMGLTALGRGDVDRLALCYERAIGLFREVDDRRGLSSALANYAQRGAVYSNPLRVVARLGDDTPLRNAEEALRIARAIGWRAGEAYALAVLANLFLFRAAYDRALPLLRDAIVIGEEIEHRQWLAIAYGTLAGFYADLLDFDRAQEYSGLAQEHARASNSRNMILQAVSWRALLYLAQGDLSAAEHLLSAETGMDANMATYPQRLAWYARAQLARATGDAEGALSIVERIIAATPGLGARAVAPMLWQLRGEIMIVLRRYGEAETQLRAARTAWGDQGHLSSLWQTHVALGNVYRLQRRRDLAEAEFEAARVVVDAQAATVSDASLRDQFHARALAKIPTLAPPTELRATRRAYGGLTARERQVAALIAAGKSNREIAEALVIGERTVETHVTHILTKLGLYARTQVAAWAVEKGLK